MKKIKLFLENVERYLADHRCCGFFISVVFILFYIICLLALIFYSLDLLDGNINPQSIVTVVLAFSVFYNLFRLH